MSSSAGAPEWTLVDHIHRGPWWANRGIFLLNLCLLVPLLTSTINGYDSSLVNGLQIVPAWQTYFRFPESKALGLINSAQNVGSLIATPFTPLASDTLGRRATLFVGSLIVVAGAAVQCAAQSVAMFVGARFIIGIGLAFTINASALLITELSYPSQRGKLVSIFNASWYTGSIIAAWATLIAFKDAGSSSWSWRVPTLVQILGSLLQLGLVWLLPESPRWLVSEGRESQAARVLAHYHARGSDERDPLIVYEMAQIRHALKSEKESTNWASWRGLVATPGNRRRLRIIVAIALFSQWSGNGLVSYYIDLVLEGVGITDTGTKAEINGGLQIWNLLSAYAAALVVDRVGRRPLFMISTAGMLVSFSMWTLTTALFQTQQNSAAARATVAMIFIFFFFYNAAYSPMLVAYTLEILPFNIRAKGYAVLNITICFTLAFNQFVNPWALDAISWKYYLVYCGWLVFELVFVWRYIVETRGRTLEETASLFDGENAPEALVAHGEAAATMSQMRMPAVHQEVTISYETVMIPHVENYELDFKAPLPPIGMSSETLTSELDALPLHAKLAPRRKC